MNAPLRESAHAPLRKGWCPGALQPMPARDGLLVRLRITGGILSSARARAIADLAERHGNGLFDLSARANLQMRGIREEGLPALWNGLRALDLLDDRVEAEAVRNVIASPLAGLHAGLDIRPLVAALESRLVAEADLHVLPTKFGFLLDDGSVPSLAGVTADVRFDWLPDDGAFSIGLGGTRRSATRIGVCEPDTLVQTATTVARASIRLFARRPDQRRMNQLVAALGATAVAVACGGACRPDLNAREDIAAASIVGHSIIAGLPVLGLAAPFGRLDAGMLRGAASVAEREGRGDIRLTPWRALLIAKVEAAGLETRRQDIDGYITDPEDPRLGVSACVGMEGCARGTTATHTDASRLADLLSPGHSARTRLHVSGCEKGCAKPSASAFTLVGRDGLYDLVRNGRAGDDPARRSLTVPAALAAISDVRETP